MALSKPNRSQLAIGIVVVVAFVIAGAFVWGFGQQLTLARQMRVEEMRLEQAVADERDINEDLEARLEYVKSDQCVEHWARAKMNMGKRGEVVVVLPQAPSEEQTDAQPTPSPRPEAQSFWSEWRELLFGSSR